MMVEEQSETTEQRADRDEKGRFVKGNRSARKYKSKDGKVQGNVGGKGGLKCEVKDQLQTAERRLPNIIANMIERAEDGDQKAAEYLIDRIYGKPSQEMKVTQDVETQPRIVFQFYQPTINQVLPEGMPISLLGVGKESLKADVSTLEAWAKS